MSSCSSHSLHNHGATHHNQDHKLLCIADKEYGPYCTYTFYTKWDELGTRRDSNNNQDCTLPDSSQSLFHCSQISKRVVRSTTAICWLAWKQIRDAQYSRAGSDSGWHHHLGGGRLILGSSKQDASSPRNLPSRLGCYCSWVCLQCYYAQA